MKIKLNIKSSKISFYDAKSCRDFVNSGKKEILLDLSDTQIYQIYFVNRRGVSGTKAIKLTNMIKISGYSIQFKEIEYLNHREFRIEKILNDEK